MRTEVSAEQELAYAEASLAERDKAAVHLRAEIKRCKSLLAERDKEIALLASTLVQEQEECGHQMGRAEQAEALLVERSFSKAEVKALLAAAFLFQRVAMSPEYRAALKSAGARLEKMRDE